MNTTPEYIFYSLLLEFLKKKGHSPQLEQRLKDIYSPNFYLQQKDFEKVLTYHFLNGSKKETLDMICEQGFKDIVGSGCKDEESEESLQMFQSFLKLADKTDHLYMLYLSIEPEFPLNVHIITNKPALVRKNATVDPDKIHVLTE